MSDAVNDNVIERTRVFKAPMERVFASIGTKEGFAKWFEGVISGEWKVGEVVLIQWPSGTKLEMLLHEIDPPTQFSYKWHPGGASMMDDLPREQLTTVTMTLSEVPEGTRLHLVESGFENLSEERKLGALGMNSKGWDEELENVRRQIEE